LNAILDRSNYAAAYEPKRPKITRRIETKYHVSSFSDEHFDVTATLFLRVQPEEAQEPILSIDASFTGHFHPKSDISRDQVESFAKGEARLIFWPYFRQIVSDTTARMHVGSITLPLVVAE
jgi:preprotein translocase subunit SecB